MGTGNLPPALARAGGRLRSVRSADPPHAPRRIVIRGRSVPLPVARRNGYAPFPPAAPSSGTDRLRHSLNTKIDPLRAVAAQAASQYVKECPSLCECSITVMLFAERATGVPSARDCMARSRRQCCSPLLPLRLHIDRARCATERASKKARLEGNADGVDTRNQRNGIGAESSTPSISPSRNRGVTAGVTPKSSERCRSKQSVMHYFVTSR
jgi:hypothetical protein